MNSTKLMLWLMLNYTIIGIFSLIEGNYPRALYWISALSITLSVLWMTK